MRTFLYFAFLLLFAAGSIFLTRTKKLRKGLLLALGILFAAEILIFNSPSFHLWFGDYESEELSLADAERNLIEADGKIGDRRATLTFSGLNKRIGTVSVSLDLPESMITADVTADITDETSAPYRNSIASKTVIRGDARSEVMVCEFSGRVGSLRLHFPAAATAEGYAVTKIEINRPVPFTFSPARLVLLFLPIALLLWLLLSPALSGKVKENEAALGDIGRVTTCVCLLIALFMITLTQFGRSGGILSDFRSQTGNQITKELVDAFEAGQVSLLAEPSEELLAMENPYDWYARSNQNVSALWDHCLYDGKYYSYYGIAPVLLLFLPYHFLTGYYFPTAEACLLFSCGGMIFLTLLYLTFIKKFFPKITVRMAAAGLFIAQASSGIWYCLANPLFYEIAQSSGFLCTTAGFYYLLSADLLGDGKPKKGRAAAATIFLALGVLCRPTLAVYCVASLLFLFFGLKKVWKDKKETVKYLLAVLLPYVLIGGVQMWYNWARFDSPLDFGIQYSLTINDFTRSEFHLRFVLIGVWNYLFSFPGLDLTFPFIHSNFETLGVNGYYFIANKSAIGIVWRALPVLSFLYAGRAVKRSKESLTKRSRIQAFLVIGAVSVLCPAVILWSIWESGYGARYCVDFSWQILLGALSIAFFLWQTCEHKEKRRLAEKALVLTVLPALLVSFALHYSYTETAVATPALKSLVKVFESLFLFWK